jgi:predicted dehydrogenase
MNATRITSNSTGNPALPRRRFLQQTAVFTTAATFPTLIPASALGAEGSVAPSERITLGCIGVGGRGRDDMHGFLSIPQARVLAVCDPYVNRQREAKQIVDEKYSDQGCAMYGDFRQVLARQDVDAVVIAPQDHWHALIATAAAQAKKDMYCEKPLGVSIEESQAIRNAVRQHDRIFQTGTQQRSEGSFRFACELARNGYVGKIHTVQVAAPGPEYRPSYHGSLEPQPVPEGFDWDMWDGPAPQKAYNPGRVAWPDWYLIWDYCAGFIVNWGVHHLDIALWGCPELAQMPFDIECQASYRNEGFTDNVNGWSGTFTYPTALKLVYTDVGKQDGGCRFIGDKGWVRVDRDGIWAEPESLLQVKIKPEEIHLHKSTNHGLDFLASVRRRQAPVADAEDGHRASYFGMLADIAARLRRKLKWDPTQEVFVDAADAMAMLHRPMRAPWKLPPAA